VRGNGIEKTPVGDYLRRAKLAGISWPIPPELGDAALERLLFGPAGFQDGATKPLPDWANVHTEFQRRSVTLITLWEEHRAEHADGQVVKFRPLILDEIQAAGDTWRRRLSRS
jgi:transposase